MYRLSSDRCQAPIPPEWNSSDKSQTCITPFMPFHFRIRGLSGIIESVGPCSHGQTLNRTAVDLHRHQLRFFLATLEHKGEDQHDCHKHQTEHIRSANRPRSPARHWCRHRPHSRSDPGPATAVEMAPHTCCMVLRMVLPSAAMRPGNDLSAADCADCWMNGMPTITMMYAAKNSTTPESTPMAKNNAPPRRRTRLGWAAE